MELVNEKKLAKSKAPVAAWDLKVKFLKGVGPKVAELMNKAGIDTLWDLLLTLPKFYEDRRHFHSLQEMAKLALIGEPVMGRGTISSYSTRPVGMGRRMLEAHVAVEGAGGAEVIFTWFNDFGGSMQRRFPEGSFVIFRGKPQLFRAQVQITHPELQSGNAELPKWESGFVPVYREIGGLSTRVLRKMVWNALDRPEVKALPEALPQDICARLGLPSFGESLWQLHFPTAWEPSGELKPGGPFYNRVVFEELFMMALALHMRRAEWKAKREAWVDRIPVVAPSSDRLAELKRGLPFDLTGDQSKVLSEVLEDISLVKEKVPMHRLVQGDVGSGKTVVAFISALSTIDAGFQAAMMAPTEILADQHFNTFAKLFPERAHEALLLKGALSVKAKKEAREKLANGQARFVIGTQALLTDTTIFEKLGLIIVDEQHRFGVEQRLGLKHQGDEWVPHLLVMTATPIPRSLALTLYGDLNLSVIREKPAGRKPIATHIVKRKAHKALAARLQKFLDEGRQLYLVYPLVEENEELDLKDVQNAFLEWKAAFPGVEVGLIHGRLKSAEKEAAMRAFKSGLSKVLVATTVIEVGVDVPNATVIVIEHAERFGLSQLHQLRGRVGRGAEQSYCVLVGPDEMGELVEERLRTMETSDDGFFIAERDLDIRGPGEFLGRRQSGLPGFRVAHILRDVGLMQTAREEARKILLGDPALERPENRPLRLLMQKWWEGRMELTLSG